VPRTWLGSFDEDGRNTRVASLEGFLDLIWTQEIGADSRELAREALRLTDRLEEEQRARLLAAFCWANWCRGRRHIHEVRERFGRLPP
jgi:hypothetical protein